MTNALNRAVVQRQMRHLDGQTFQRFEFNGVAVILRGYGNLARFQIFDGLIATVMPEFQFVGVRAHCQSQNLMTEANAENRTLAD